MTSESALEKDASLVETHSHTQQHWYHILVQGVWGNNASLVQLLGLCPLLAVSNSVANALGLGLATTVVLIATNSVISLFRRFIPQEIRIPIYVMIIATTVTAVQFLMNAYTYSLYQTLGIFIPLIVTNCIVIGRAEAFASKNSLGYSLLDGLAMGLGMTLTLVLLGALREFLGTGKLFYGLENLFGEGARSWHLDILSLKTPFLIAILPAGAFIGLALLLAIKNVIDDKRKKNQ